jgi:hypothetical protein
MVDQPKGSQALKRQPSLKGLVMQDLVRGQTRVRAWPVNRGKPKTKAEADAQDEFRLAQKMASYFAPGCLAYIHKATAKSPLLVRDVVTMQLYNRWMAFQLEDGRTLYPMPAINDVSESLDVLGSAEGMFLLRTPEGWRGVPYVPVEPKQTVTARVAINTGFNVPSGTIPALLPDEVRSDPDGWWQGNTIRGFKPTQPGIYYLESSLTRTGEGGFQTGVTNITTNTALVSGSQSTTNIVSVASTMLYLDGETTVAWRAFSGSGFAIRGGSGQSNYFAVTGPF